MTDLLGNAWERRGEVGFLQGFVEAVKDFATAPGKTFEESRRSGDALSPILYAVILGMIGQIASFLWSSVFGPGNWVQYLPPEFQEKMGGYVMASSGPSILWLFIAPFALVIGLFIGAAILHLCLLVVGGVKDSEAGFEGTLRSLGYAQTAGLAQLIPLVGSLVAFFWTLVLVVIGFVRLHRTGEARAVVAVLLPLLLCCVCVVVVFAFGIATAASVFGAS